VGVRIDTKAIHSDKWIEVRLAPGVVLELLTHRPTLNEQLCLPDRDRSPESKWSWIEAAIVDWRGVEDMNGDPLPFTKASVEALCRAFPQAFTLIDSAAYTQFYAVPDEDSLKNLPTPPVNGGTITEGETEVGTASLDYSSEPNDAKPFADNLAA
jgi:hypothetical protein